MTRIKRNKANTLALDRTLSPAFLFFVVVPFLILGLRETSSARGTQVGGCEEEAEQVEPQECAQSEF